MRYLKKMLSDKTIILVFLSFTLFMPTKVFGFWFGYERQYPETLFGGPTINGAYDYASQIFSARIDDMGWANILAGNRIDDFEGYFTLNAKIDHAGNLIEGVTALIGGSESMGIADNTLLLRGEIIDLNFGTDPATRFWGFEFLVNVLDSHSAMAFNNLVDAIISAPASNYLRLPEESWFTESFYVPAPWDVCGIVNLEATAPVAEPSTIFMFCAGLGAWVVKRRFPKNKYH